MLDMEINGENKYFIYYDTNNNELKLRVNEGESPITNTNNATSPKLTSLNNEAYVAYVKNSVIYAGTEGSISATALQNAICIDLESINNTPYLAVKHDDVTDYVSIYRLDNNTWKQLGVIEGVPNDVIGSCNLALSVKNINGLITPFVGFITLDSKLKVKSFR
jgi:hypothetical protein